MIHKAHMRPRFEIPVRGDGQVVLDSIKRQLEEPDAEFEGQVVEGHAYLRFPEAKRSMLSPNLEIDLLDEGKGPVLYGRFSPQPNVWTGFMAVFFTLGMIGMGGLVWGFAVMPLDGDLWPMWLAPGSLALIGFIYGAAFIGQGLSTEEMFALRAFVECTVREVCGKD